MSNETLERGGVILCTGTRRFTTEYTRTDLSRLEIWRMPDDKEIEFHNGPVLISPSQWIEINDHDEKLGNVTQADIMAAR